MIISYGHLMVSVATCDLGVAKYGENCRNNDSFRTKYHLNLIYKGILVF